MKEQAFLFGADRSLVGVVTDPAEEKHGNQLPAVIILNSGIVHRVGLNRLHVKMARNLAASGFVVMRFDFSGIGDSNVREDHLPFQKSAMAETQAAMNYLAATRGIERFVVIGICSGAAVSIRTACADSRVAGIIPINNRGYFHGFNAESSATFRNRALAHHYRRIAFSSSFKGKNWLKAITGKVDYRGFLRVAGFQLSNLFAPKKDLGVASENPFELNMRLLADRGVQVLLVHSEGDEGLDYLQVIAGKEGLKQRQSQLFRLEIIPGANHTFTLLWSQKHLLKLVEDWLLENLRRRA
jgi:dienelactone hydrolase